VPLYEYKCEGCGEVFEVIQKFADEPLTVHEKCGGHVQRLMSAPAFQFKGTGWYVTDYAKGNSGGPAKSDHGKSETSTATETKSESKAESKSDAKSEAKTETKPAASSDKS
jgi:putative FmdB family regulatory protein